MTKKRVLIFFLAFVLALTFVIAQGNVSNSSGSLSTNSESAIDQAYLCLDDRISEKDQSSISLQEAIFGILALGSNSKLISIIDDKAIEGDHWSESSSDIKDTAQVMLAYERINKNSEDIESWLLSNEISAKDLTWSLQIDVPNIITPQITNVACTISYADEQRTITVNEDMTLSGNPGTCLSIDSTGFWLRVNNNCIDETFTMTCDQDFLTSLLYQKGSSQNIFVSPETHSSSALGTTQETINSKCLSTSSSCDYEGTLWAAIALDSVGTDISKYIPYLQALSESNVRYLPSAFLHNIILGSNQYSQLVGLQQQDKYWQAPNTPYSRFYDSASAMLSLQGTGSTELDNAKAYFESIVTPEGCWNNNNLRDTGFLLYGGWPRSVPSTGGGPPSPSQSCESLGFSCTSLFSCEGTVLQHDCNSGVCCSETPQQETCAEQEGEICSSGETCSGTTPPSSDSGICCLGSCNPLPSSNECQTKGGICDNKCEDDEDKVSFTCEGSDICCVAKSDSSEEGFGITWIVVLSILILIVLLLIVFRRKIQLALFKRKGPSRPSSQRGLPPGGRPPFPPGRGPIPLRGPGPRRVVRRGPQTLHLRKSSKSDKEMEETMRRLKEISK
jgi:hypothetical protein